MNSLKSFTLLSIFLLAFFSVYCQDVALPDIVFKNDIAYYNNRPFTGHCYEYYTNGRLKYECNYKNGIKHGNETTYYDNGQKRLVKNFNEGLPDGDCSYKFYSVDGQLRSELDYEMGEKTGQIIYAELFYYPVIIGEKNGSISKRYIQQQKNVRIEILRTYNQYFDKNGKFNSAEFSNVEFTRDMDFVIDGQGQDELFISFRMKGRLPIDPERETIYYDLKYESKPNRKRELSQSMLDCFDNKYVKELTLDEVFMRKVIDGKNILWSLPPRTLVLTD